MGIRKGLGLASAAVLGAAVAVLPAVASSEGTPTVQAENVALYVHHWTPPEVTVGEGGTLSIANETAVYHGVEWRSGPEQPVCSGVPVGTTSGASATNWKGTCTFKQAGTYVFWCTVHKEAMTATVIVTPAGTTTTGTTGTTTGGTTGTVPVGAGGGGTSSSPSGSPAASLLASAAITAVKVHSQQRGRAVSGFVNVSSAGAGSTLEVDLLAKRASLASARSSFVRVGRTIRSAVGPGLVKFRVPLSASGRRALARAGRLVLRVQITLTPRAGGAVSVRRTITLRA